MTPLSLRDLPPTALVIMYDGECPACARFFPRYVQLLKVGKSALLLNAREHPDLIRELYDKEHLNINRDGAVLYQGRWYGGGAGLNIIMCAAGLKSRWVAGAIGGLLALIYPLLRLGRYALLWILGRRPIDLTGDQSPAP